MGCAERRNEMLKTVGKFVLLAVFASLFALSHAQASQELRKCMLIGEQCVYVACPGVCLKNCSICEV